MLESHPKTPAQLLRAIDILLDLDRADLARPLVEELSQKKLNVTAKAALVNQFNSATLMKLAHNAELAAVLGPLVDDLFQSAEAYRRDPKRLATWAQQLQDRRRNGSARKPRLALLCGPAKPRWLRWSRSWPIPSGPAEHAMAQEILVQLDDLAIEPLLGVLEAPTRAERRK